MKVGTCQRAPFKKFMEIVNFSTVQRSDFWKQYHPPLTERRNMRPRNMLRWLFTRNKIRFRGNQKKILTKSCWVKLLNTKIYLRVECTTTFGTYEPNTISTTTLFSLGVCVCGRVCATLNLLKYLLNAFVDDADNDDGHGGGDSDGGNGGNTGQRSTTVHVRSTTEFQCGGSVHVNTFTFKTFQQI